MAVLSQKIGIRGLKRLGIFKGDDNDLFESNVIKVFYPHGLGHLVGLNVHDDGLGLSVQHPSQLTSDADSLSKLPVQFHPINTNTVAESLIELPPPSSRRNKAVGSSFYAKPSTKLEPGMLVTVEPGIYFNPAQIQYALENPHLAQYLDEATIRRYMSVGGVRIEDVVLVLPNGSVENITTAPKDLREVEQIVQEGQRKHRESQELRQPSKIAEKKHEKQSPLTEISQDAPQRLKKRVGVFKKLLHDSQSDI
ncbi:hypothetical protein BGZ54_003431 [Gamsiella multidivaricata]|nr:hypothetical protein BGZ54_003431 [Gamsiella multidivaricata]